MIQYFSVSLFKLCSDRLPAEWRLTICYRVSKGSFKDTEVGVTFLGDVKHFYLHYYALSIKYEIITTYKFHSMVSQSLFMGIVPPHKEFGLL